MGVKVLKYDEWDWSEFKQYKSILLKIYLRCGKKAFIMNFAKNKN